jgi:hypothetical protein
VIGKYSSTLIAMVLGWAPGMAVAADQNGMFAVKGVGALNCEAYVNAAEAGDRDLAQYAGYITGYISAVNEVQPDTFDLVPWQHVDTVMLLMLQRCRQMPELNFGAAVAQMARYFGQHRLAGPADRVSGTSEGDGADLYEPVVTEIKAALGRWGYPTEDLKASLREFQNDLELTGEGEFGQQTLLKLLYGKAPD